MHGSDRDSGRDSHTQRWRAGQDGRGLVNLQVPLPARTLPVLPSSPPQLTPGTGGLVGLEVGKGGAGTPPGRQDISWVWVLPCMETGRQGPLDELLPGLPQTDPIPFPGAGRQGGITGQGQADLSLPPPLPNTTPFPTPPTPSSPSVCIVPFPTYVTFIWYFTIYLCLVPCQVED